MKAEGAAASAKKTTRPRSAVKGKAGKMLPKGPSTAVSRKKQGGASDEQSTRKRGAPEA